MARVRQALDACFDVIVNLDRYRANDSSRHNQPSEVLKGNTLPY
jgi:hypothetical protein